ncbi:MAG: triose-phosphate isomerase [Candidatus Caldarchaeum sp.]|uniref:Triosephosphate isomerase n=1 Tax=Caldiarchaeum subterraneum TaxID=311458 RepID=A0A7C5LGE1_CALS0
MRLDIPTIILNFKAFREALGNHALELAKTAEKVSLETGVQVAVCPCLTDLQNVVNHVSIPVLAQHCDPHKPGPFTGSVVAESLKTIGVVGSLLNHSEKRMKLSDLTLSVTRLRENGLISVVCADDVSAAVAAAALKPDAVAVEPPELIGTGISVSTAKPEVVSEAVARVKTANPNVVVLCGAGVSTAEDVRKAVMLGAEGVLLSTAYVKSRDPEKLLREMCLATKG